MLKAYRSVVAFLPKLWTNWITLFGAALTSVSGIAIVTALAIDFSSDGTLNPYAATILFLLMPAVLVCGLLLIPLGLYKERLKRRRHPSAVVAPDPLLDAFAQAMASGTARRRVIFVLLATVLNVFIFATVTHQAVTFMETPKFCGSVCHTVMQPEYEAYQRSPHSRVACVECHIGSGATSAVHAKLSGLRQLWGVATGTYHRPIETPVHNLRPASETCEQCHQPAKFSGSRLGFRVRYKDDEANTPQVTAMMFPVGGEDPATKNYEGIHWHVSKRFQVRYEALDSQRQTVGKIQKLDNGKVVEEWLPPPGSAGKVVEVRTMDCIDCHNRPTHIYDGPPTAAINRAFTMGLLDRGVPWLHQMGLAALKDATPPRDQAEAYFQTALERGYGREHPAQRPAADKLAAASRGLATLYRRNVFPEMKVTWNSYRSNIGHGGPDPGAAKTECFRCHSGDHKTKDGRELSSKCESCHEVIAKDELPEDLPDEIRGFLHL
jgi:nitrate/TMAO reductase-like tetraheme cytochrome c subunit